MSESGSNDRKAVLTCVECETPVTATAVGTVVDEIIEDNGQVTLFSCDDCGAALLYQEEIIDGPRKARLVVGARLWPVPDSQLSTKIPLTLRREYTQARTCFGARAYTAAALMVRRTLEGVCIEHKITEKPLARALPKMHTEGLIDTRLLEWAQALRVLGNEAAHFTGCEVTREDAADALDLAEALLDYIYVLAAKFNKFQGRRTRREHNTGESSPAAERPVVHATAPLTAAG